MKAREYYEKYKDDYFGSSRTYESVQQSTRNLAVEFVEEVEIICKERKAHNGSAIVSVFKELNSKWNALSRIFEKEHGLSPFQEDGFKKLSFEIMPQLTEFWKQERNNI